MKQIIENYLDTVVANRAYIDSIPEPFSTSVLENQYTTNLERQSEQLLKHILGPRLFDEVMWWLYESSRPARVATQNKEYSLHTNKDFLGYLKENYVII